jgi:hypothetical protein
MKENFTTDEIEATEVQQPAKPEWYDLPNAARASGICRSLLYQAIADGHIRSVCLRKKNAVRGRRLINAQSLFAWISRQPSGIDSRDRKRMLQLRKLPRKERT